MYGLWALMTMQDGLKFIITVHGEQFVMTIGT